MWEPEGVGERELRHLQPTAAEGECGLAVARSLISRKAINWNFYVKCLCL